MTEEVIFKPGDIVLLKSGSRWMTVASAGDVHVNVIWLPYGTSEIQHDKLPKSVLRHR